MLSPPLEGTKFGSNAPRNRKVLDLLKRLGDARRRLALGCLAIAVALGVWQLSSSVGWTEPAFSSSPSRVWSSFLSYFGDGGTGWTDLVASGEEFIYGFLIAIGIGVPLGILMGWYRDLDSMLNPAMVFLNNAPRIAIAPLFVIWFGIGLSSKVWVVVLSALVPIVFSARGGVNTLDKALIAMARSYGSSDTRILRTVVLPGVVPGVAEGIRIGIGQAWTGVVLAEYVASTKGIGYVVVQSAANFNTDRLFAAVVEFALLGMVASGVLMVVQRRMERWRAA